MLWNPGAAGLRLLRRRCCPAAVLSCPALLECCPRLLGCRPLMPELTACKVNRAGQPPRATSVSACSETVSQLWQELYRDSQGQQGMTVTNDKLVCCKDLAAKASTS